MIDLLFKLFYLGFILTANKLQLLLLLFIDHPTYYDLIPLLFLAHQPLLFLHKPHFTFGVSQLSAHFFIELRLLTFLLVVLGLQPVILDEQVIVLDELL